MTVGWGLIASMGGWSDFCWFRLPFCLFVEGEAKRKPESMLGVLQKEETHHVWGRRVPSGVRSSLELSLASSRELAERLVTSCSWREKRWLGCMAHIGTSVSTSAKMSWVFGVLLCDKKKQAKRKTTGSLKKADPFCSGSPDVHQTQKQQLF